MKKSGWKKRIAALMLMGTMAVSMIACGSADYAETAEISYYGINSSHSQGYYENGFGGSSYTDGSMKEAVAEEVTMEYAEAETPGANKGNAGDVTTNRKLIRTVTMEVETENFEGMISGVEDKVSELGGYIESAYTYNGSAYANHRKRYAEMTLRVPDLKLEDFVGQISDCSNVISKTTTTEDITLQYVDTEGMKEMYIAEETSLLALLEKAESVEDISYLTTRLSEVRYNIENLESRLLKYDDLVEYATIHLYIEEVEVYTPVVTEEKSVWEEITDGFSASVKDIWNSLVRFSINLVINLPYIIRFLVVAGLIILAFRLIIVIIKKAIKKKKAKNKPAQKTETSKSEKPEGRDEE